MKYRQIETSFWNDGYILELTSKEREFFIYLFTNDRVNMVGIYELPDRTIRATLGATLEELEAMKKKFEMDGKYHFFNGWVFVDNFFEHNKYSSAKPVVLSYIKEFNSIPQKILGRFLRNMRLFFKPTIISDVITIDVKEDKIEARSSREDVNPEDVPF